MSIQTNQTTDTLTPSGGVLKVASTVESTTGGFKFPDGTTQTTAAAGGTDQAFTFSKLNLMGL